jgi:hypothetical protein
MHIAHAIVGHAVLSLLMLSGLAALFLAAFRLDRNTKAAHGGLGAPLDQDLVERWNRAGAALTPAR